MTYEQQRAQQEGARAKRSQANGPTAKRSQASASTGQRSQAAANSPANTTTTQQGDAQQGASAPAEKTAWRPPILLIVIIIVLVAAIMFASRIFSSAATIDVTVNGAAYTLHGAKTVQTAIRESGLPINPGDFISIRGSVLKKSAGNPFDATVNGKEVVDPDYQLHDGDDVVVTDGKDIVEEYDTAEQRTTHMATIDGAGAIHQFTAGEDGVLEIRTGRDSGEVVERLVSEPSDAFCLKYNPEVGDDKVLALTFDEGPSEEYTAEILDILKENDARATFFCVGTEIEKYNDWLVKREVEEGHQVGTGTYDHARKTDGNSVAGLDDESLIEQVERGRDVIAAALDGQEASRIVRLPGGELDEDMVRALDQYVDAEIGWNVDTGDWTEPSADEVYRVLMSLEPGDIVLCHDGGGDHSGTVEALRRAIPKLREQGYSFVTIDDLMQYPAQQ